MTKARLLVVEDEAELRADLIELLELCDFEVDGSGNGAEAFALIQRDQPDLVICDVQLPGMTGIEILNSLLGARGYRPFMVMFTMYCVVAFVELSSSIHSADAVWAHAAASHDLTCRAVDGSPPASLMVYEPEF